jgi:hypothetical protein
MGAQTAALQLEATDCITAMSTTSVCLQNMVNLFHPNKSIVMILPGLAGIPHQRTIFFFAVDSLQDWQMAVERSYEQPERRTLTRVRAVSLCSAEATGSGNVLICSLG